MYTSQKNEQTRLSSLDALRGFDMFWIMGAESIIISLGALTGLPCFKWMATQMHHVPWHGFVFYDMIFPLFLFIAGISFPFSVAKKQDEPGMRKLLYKRIFVRGLVLTMLGVIYNNGFSVDYTELRYGSVLGRIGLAWMLAALLYINTGRKLRIALCAGILIVYWLVLILFPATDLGATDPFSMEGSLVGYIDRIFMPGKLCYPMIHDPEGILSTLPAISTALMGMLTGEFIISDFRKDKPFAKVAYMTVAAVLLILTGLLWNGLFPINKNLWTSSFVCMTGGISLLLFALFYLVIDVLGFKSWSKFFIVIGVNSITIYLAQQFISFKYTSKILFGSIIGMFPENMHPFLDATVYTCISWLFLYMLYRKRIFLKV